METSWRSRISCTFQCLETQITIKTMPHLRYPQSAASQAAKTSPATAKKNQQKCQQKCQQKALQKYSPGATKNAAKIAAKMSAKMSAKICSTNLPLPACQTRYRIKVTCLKTRQNIFAAIFAVAYLFAVQFAARLACTAGHSVSAVRGW